eukprot:CAMPEP_0185756742 /NCGR_PEP_ID=MMETSP1174-20130828/15154_1 /TAXON_ID=35687 /ORGANISM="Dictyocha speculum, Strain CCMP1381" /LENGTH=300 /DNA_ID=CAMNT_0028435835 /DNA_START=14 /DNA_END=919 /DNA_ORIENTATION=-
MKIAMLLMIPAFGLSCATGEESVYSISDPQCGDLCLDDSISSYAIKYGPVESGNCIDQGYTVANGSSTTDVGPFGTYTVNLWTKPEEYSVEDAYSTSDCATVEPLAAVDIDLFLEHTWYSQQQQITSYQPADELYCVSATYNNSGASIPFFSGFVASVYNYGDKDAVNGEPVNTADGQVLCASQSDPAIAGMLGVAPCFLPTLFTGAYWIVAVGESESDGAYDWVVVSGGQPNTEQDDGLCTIGSPTGYFGGLWIFTRESVASAETLQAAQEAVTALGISSALLVDVVQEGCTYSEAYIK